MKPIINKKIRQIVESAGFSIGEMAEQDNGIYVELSQFTPLGEDWFETIWFDGTSKGFCKGLRERYNEFDVDDEAEIWIERRGKHGVPSSIKDLIEDAEWKELVLEELCDKLPY